MKYLDNLKRTMEFLTAAMTLSMAMAGCSAEISDSDKNSVQSSVVSETSEPQNTESTTEETTTETTESETENISETETKNVAEAETLSNKQVKTSSSDLFSERDLNPEYTEISAEITLNGDSVEINGSGVSAEGSVITISSEGVYKFTGKLDDGQIIVNADKAKVQIILDNAEITSKTSAPIYAVDSDKVFITLAENSINKLTDAEQYVYSEENSEEPDACIFSKDSLTINGTGSLEINANYNDGIKSKDDVVITGGSINITSTGDGISGKDYVAVADGNITVVSGADGIKSTNAVDTSLGFVYIEGGTISITAENDGIQAETDLIATGGNFNIVTGGGSENSTKTHTDDMMGGGFSGGRGNFGGDFGEDFGGFDRGQDFGNFGGFGGDFGNAPDMTAETSFTNLAFTQTDNTSQQEESESQKGLKGGTSVQISGGSYTVDSSDDAIHSNGNVTISGGEITVTAGDDGLHADSTAEITDGSFIITKSYEGIESAVINIKGGLVEVNSSDDGFNASDGTAQGGMGTFSSGVLLDISGGVVYVNASGDGLDSNGEMTISGGTVIVDGPTNDGNGALDSNSSITVTGGLIVATGSSGMAESPDKNSTQNSVSATFESYYEGGTMVTLLDESGKEILSFTPSKKFNNIVISSSDIETGSTYTFYTGGTSSSESKYGLYVTGGYNNDGSEAGSFTADSVTSYVGTQSGMMGGGRGSFRNGMNDGENGMMKGGRREFNGNMEDMTPPDNQDGMMPPEMPNQN